MRGWPDLLVMNVGVWIILLSLAGLVISIYFTLAYYGRVRKARWVPEILCAREGSSCVTVLQTPYACVFGVPNSLLGIIYYLGLIIWLNLRISVAGVAAFLVAIATVALTVAIGVSVLLGFYLIYALRMKLRINCPLCYAVHAINAVLLILLIVPVR